MTDEASIDAAAALWGASGREALELDNLLTGLWETDETPSAARCLADARQEHTFSAQPSFLGSATGHDVVAPQTTPGPGYGTSQPHHLATNPAFLGQQHSLEGQQQQQQQQRQHATEPIMHRQYSNQAQQQQAVPSLASNAPARLCGAQPHPLAHPPRQQPHAHAPPLRVGHDFVSGASHGGAAPGALLSAPSLPATPPATTNTPPDQPQPPTIPSDVGPTAASAQLSSLPCRTATWPAAAPAWGLTHQHTGVGELNGAGRGMGLGLRPGPGSGPDAQPFTPHCHAVAPHASANVHYHHPQQQQQHRHQLHSSRAKAQQDGRAGGPNCLQHANPAGDDPMALDPGATHTAVGALPAAPGSAAARPRPHPAHVTAATPFASAASQAAAAALPPEPWTHDATQQQQQQHVQQQAQQQQRPSADSLAQSGGAELRLPQLQAVPGQEAVRLPHAEGEEAASPSTARGLPQPYIHHPHPHPYARYASRLSHPHLPPPPHYPYPYPYPYAYPYSPYPPPHPRARPGYFPPPPVPPAPPPHPYPHPAVSPIKPPPTPHPYPYAPPARHPVSRNLSTGALPAPPFRPGPFPPPYLQPPAHPFAPSASPGTGPGPMRRVPSWHTGLSGAAAAAAVNNEQLSYHRNGQDQQQQQQDQGAVVAPYESHPSGLQLPPQAAAEGQQQHEQQQQHQEQPLAGDAMVAAGQPGPRPRVHGGPARQAPPPSAFHHHHHLHHHHLQHDEGQLRRGSCGSSEGPASSSSGSSGPGGRQADRARAAAAATAGGSGSGLPVSPSNGAAHSGWLQGSSWALQGQGHAAAVAAALHPEALPQQPAPGLEAHPPGAPGPCQRPEQQQQQLAGAPAPGGALGVKPRSVSADGRQGPAMGLGPGLGPGGPPGLTRLGLQAMQQRGRHEQQPQPQHAGAKRLRVAFGIEEPDPDCDPLPDPGRGLGLGLLPPPPAPNAVPHGSGGGRDWWLAPAASAPLPDLPQQPSSSPSPPPAQPQSPSAPPQQPHLSSPPPQQSGAAPAQAHHSPKRQRTAAMRPSPSPSCSSLPSMDWALALPPPAQPPPPPPLHLQPLAATARTDVGLQMDMDVDMHMEIACMSAASAPAAAAGGCSSGPDGALTAAALEGFDADWALGLGLGGVEVSSLSCGGALPSVHAATGGAEGRAAGPPPASPSPPPSMPVLQTSGSAQPTPPPPPPPPPPLPLLQHERPTATVVQTGGPRLPETPAEQQQQQRKNSSAPKSKGVKVMVEEVQERADDALEGECGEEDAAGLPEPVQVTVVPATAACPEEEAILGTFHPAPYLAGKNCICVQRLPPPHVLAAAAAAGSGGGGRASGGGARLGGSGGGGGLSAIGGVGDFVSRSGFERLGGSIMAKWYRSIKVLPEGTPLGRWLTEQGLPVIKGGPRRARPHGSLRGAASANRAAAVARSSGGGGSRRGGSGGGKRSRRAAANRDTDDDTDSDLDE